MFFPDALIRQYAGRSKSNLTWFYTGDAKNKSVRRSLIDMLRQDPMAVVRQTHLKCREVLWPESGRAVFDADALKAVLARVRFPFAANAGRGTVEGAERLELYFRADEASALARVILTLAVAGDAPADVMAAIWGESADSDISFMEADDSVEGQIRYCRMLDLQGRYEKAFEGYERAARRLGRPAQTPDESLLYCRLGEMLFKGEGCGRDEAAARAYDRLGCMDEVPASWLQLSAHSHGTEAREALERSAKLGFGPALYQLGMALYNGSARLSCLRDPEAARRCFQQGLSLPGEDGAKCAWMLGQISQALGERDAALNAYHIARQYGSPEAARQLSRPDWVLSPPAPPQAQSASGATEGYCLTNGAEGLNRRFLESLEGRWDVTVCAAAPAGGFNCVPQPPEQVLQKLARSVYWGGAASFPPLVIALLSEDKQRNLIQAATLLSELLRLAHALGERAWDLVDQAEIYLLADHDEGGLLLDTLFSGEEELYFRVRLCDPALDAADRLLSAAPLFLPRLGRPADAPVRLKVIGSGEAALAVLRRAIAMPLPEAAQRSIDVYAEDAEAMARRLYGLCPGLRADGEGLCEPLPRFHALCPDTDLPAAMEETGDLAQGDYYVVAVGDDAQNIRLGALLRGELLRRSPRAEGMPFIAVHIAHPVTRWLAGSLSAGAEGAAAWCGQYELFPFGAADRLTLPEMRRDPLERQARQAHMLYLGLPDTRDARHAAMGSYYRRQLSRDVARLTALSLPCRMHLAGIDLPNWRLYGVPGEADRLGEAYTRWLGQEDHLTAALRQEHARRNRAMISLGWAPASPEDVAAYVGSGNPGHRLYPARLDPFICPWEALEDGERLRLVRRIVRRRFPERSVPDPRRDEEASLRDTQRILGG